MTQLTDLPLREELRGKSAYGAPQLTVATNSIPMKIPIRPLQRSLLIWWRRLSALPPRSIAIRNAMP